VSWCSRGLGMRHKRNDRRQDGQFVLREGIWCRPVFLEREPFQPGQRHRTRYAPQSAASPAVQLFYRPTATFRTSGASLARSDRADVIPLEVLSTEQLDRGPTAVWAGSPLWTGDEPRIATNTVELRPGIHITAIRGVLLIGVAVLQRDTANPAHLDLRIDHPCLGER